jgi:hypothetical protein
MKEEDDLFDESANDDLPLNELQSNNSPFYVQSISLLRDDDDGDDVDILLQ